jgi:hypothetical protein
MTDQTYNGWKGHGNRGSAYATWRIALELVDDMDLADVWREPPDERELADYLRDSVVDFVCAEDPNAEMTVTQYALAFLDDVSWQEIAENILENWENDTARPEV